jgi:hypothetical protein
MTAPGRKYRFNPIMKDRVTSIAPRRHHTGFIQPVSAFIVGLPQRLENGAPAEATPFPVLYFIPSEDIDRAFLRRT